MKKSTLILCVITCILFILNFNICYANDVIEINGDDVTEIEIHAGGPMYSDHLKYNYQTSSSDEIKYLINLLTSLSLTDDGSCVYANDVPIYYISIKQNDDTVIKYIFETCRFTDNNGKQYAADLNEYNRFLDTVHALKNKLLKLPDDISFEPSGWAKESVKSCACLGLFRGDEKGNFNPKDNISKEECIVTINRLYKIAES